MEQRNHSDWEQAQMEEELLEQALRQREFSDSGDAAHTEPPEKKDPGIRSKHPWQVTKESWYDKLHVSVRQLDIIIGVASVALAIVVILIILDAMGLR